MERYSVLFVDDEPNILRSLARLFHQESFDVLMATGGEEALEIVKNQPVQLVVTDNIMPKMTGVELIKQVKRIAPDTLRIILSGQSDMQAVLSSVNEGEAFRFLLKPWVDGDLKANIYIALAHYKLLQDIKVLKQQAAEIDEVLAYICGTCPELLKSAPPKIAMIMAAGTRRFAVDETVEVE